MKFDDSLPLSQNPRPPPLVTSRMLIYAGTIPEESIYFPIHFCFCRWQLFYQRSIFILYTA